MPTSRIDAVACTYERKGPCAVCGESCQRSRTIKAGSLEAVEATAAAIQSRPLMHKRCELNYLGEEFPW